MKYIVLFKTPESLYFEEIKRKEDIKNFDVDGFLLNADEKECRRTIEFLKQKLKGSEKKIKIAVVGREDEFNRRALETLKIDYLVSPENTFQRDSLKQRASGFNHVLAEIAKQKNIAVIVDLTRLNSITDKKQKALRVAKIIQNIKICRKSNCPIKLATFAKNESELLDEKQIAAIGFSLGMSSQQAVEAFNF